MDGMPKEEELKAPQGLTLEQAHNIRRDREINDLREQLKEVLATLGRRNSSHSPQRSEKSAHKSDSEEEEDSALRNYKSKDDDRGLRLDIPEFDGSMKPEVFLEWLQRIERIFDYKDYDDRKRFKVAVLKLTGYANLWYENLKSKRRKEGKARINSWETLKVRMKKCFLPTDYVQDIFLKLQGFKQDALSIEEYTIEFDKLIMLCDLEERVEHKIARFLAGLNPSIAEKVDLQPYWSFEEVCKVAS